MTVGAVDCLVLTTKTSFYSAAGGTAVSLNEVTIVAFLTGVKSVVSAESLAKTVRIYTVANRTTRTSIGGVSDTTATIRY